MSRLVSDFFTNRNSTISEVSFCTFIVLIDGRNLDSSDLKRLFRIQTKLDIHSDYFEWEELIILIKENTPQRLTVCFITKDVQNKEIKQQSAIAFWLYEQNYVSFSFKITCNILKSCLIYFCTIFSHAQIW